MSTKDINIFESGSGGEMRILNSDLLMAETIYQTIYLALYGGNVDKVYQDGTAIPISMQNTVGVLNYGN